MHAIRASSVAARHACYRSPDAPRLPLALVVSTAVAPVQYGFSGSRIGCTLVVVSGDPMVLPTKAALSGSRTTWTREAFGPLRPAAASRRLALIARIAM